MIGENGGGDKEGVVMETVRVKETMAVVVVVVVVKRGKRVKSENVHQ